MRVTIVRTMPGESLSMDVYADGLVDGLREVRPRWDIDQIAPRFVEGEGALWVKGFKKYYERYWHYPRLLSEVKGDVFHVVDHSYGYLAYWLKRMTGLVLVTCHDLINFYQPQNLYAKAQLPLVSMKLWRLSVRGLRHADRVIADSNNTADDLKKYLGLSKEMLEVVPLAIGPVFCVIDQEEVDAFRSEHNVSKDTLCLLYVGSVQVRKNVQTILEVVKVLASKGMKIHLWTAGEEFHFDQREFIRENNLDGMITCLGTLGHESLVSVYNAADVFLFPSLHEGFGMPVLEAMACGTPVVTSNVSSLPEVAGNAAILVDPRNVHEIAEAVISLQSDKEYRKQLIHRGLVRAQSFTWRRIAEQTAAIYEELVGGI